MGEVTEMFDVNASLIRYWESKFDCIKPHKNKKGNRMFTPSDIENFKLIYHLVKEKGMTLEGANSAMKRRNKSVKRDVSILERLQNIRAMLVEVRESLGDNSPIEYEAPIEAVAELISDVEQEAKAEVVELIRVYAVAQEYSEHVEKVTNADISIYADELYPSLYYTFYLQGNYYPTVDDIIDLYGKTALRAALTFDRIMDYFLATDEKADHVKYTNLGEIKYVG